MLKKSSRRLAGYIAIELISAAAGLRAADTKYKASISNAGLVKALVLADGRGGQAVFAQADFAITQAISDFVAARLLQAYELPRPSLLLRGAGAQTPQPEDLITAIGAAMGRMEPALVRFDGTTVSVISAGACMATLTSNLSLSFDRCTTGAGVTGAFRAAFQMVNPAHGLLQRSDSPHAFPVQAIALGKQITIVALGGASLFPRDLSVRGLLFVSQANDSVAPPDDARMPEAIRQVLSRVGR